MKFFAALVVLLLTASPASAAAPKWTVDPAASEIAFSGKHAGNEFKGTFKTWTADIAFDPADLAGSKAKVTVEMGSAVTGNKTYDGSLPSAEWLDPKAFPDAVFETKSFTKTGENAYTAAGTLTIKGVSQDVSLPFTLKTEGDKTLMDGSLTLDRLLYKVGTASDPKAEWVSKDIAVTVKVTATKAP